MVLKMCVIPQVNNLTIAFEMTSNLNRTYSIETDQDFIFYVYFSGLLSGWGVSMSSMFLEQCSLNLESCDTCDWSPFLTEGYRGGQPKLLCCGLA